MIKYDILDLLENIPVCNGDSKQNVWEAYRVDISFIIKARTPEGKAGTINNCSGQKKHKQALALRACLLRALECTTLVWTLTCKFSWGSSKDSAPTEYHCASAGVSCPGVARWCLTEKRLCMVYRLLWACSLFLPA